MTSRQHADIESSNVNSAIYKSSNDVDNICLKLATSSVVKDNRLMDEQPASDWKSNHDVENTVDSRCLPAVDESSSTTSRCKIIPSIDLLHDCYYSSDSSNPDVDQQLSRGGTSREHWTSTDNESAASIKTPESLTTPDLFDDSVFDGELDWIDSRPSSAADTLTTSKAARQHAVDGNDDDHRSDQWSTVTISDKQYRLDLKVIEPYKRVLSHGGYYGDGYNAIIVITACYLPDKGRRDYHYVMRNLFLYVISTLELLVMDDYMIIYFHGAAPRRKMPSFRWLRQCYEMIDRRYKKKLKKLLIVHPTFFLRTVMLMAKPFISSKFYCKLQYVRSLDELRYLVPLDHVFVCDEIKQYDTLRPLENVNSK